MTIIKIKRHKDGFYEMQSQSHRDENWMGPEWAIVPERIHISVPYGEATFFDGYLVNWVQGEPPRMPPDTTVTTDALMDWPGLYAARIANGSLSITDVPEEYLLKTKEVLNEFL